jgi:hypothetical protein
MSDYFSTVREGLAQAVTQRAHLRWYRRLRVPHGRPLALVLAALVVATPAVGAVAGWFSQGRPDSTGPVSSGTLFGVVKPGHSRILPLRVADAQGGPPWALRLVRTTRGDTCVLLGRVQNGQLGSLGIADAWDNDHKFHAIPPSARSAQDCGSTDAAGHGFVSRGTLGESASANLVGDFIAGPQASGCRLSVGGGNPSRPICPKGANRIVFYGLLGPDAVSITYRKPGGGLATQPTSGGVGAYLLVFPYNAATCAEYDQTASSSVSCNGESEAGVSPVVPGAVTKVAYTHGRTCSLTENAQSLLLPRCPAIGYVPFTAKKVTDAPVASPVHVREFPIGVYGCPNKLRLPSGCDGVTEDASHELPVEWSFQARLPVTNSHSWYEWFLQPPQGCGSGGESSATFSNIHAGQLLRYSTFLPASCRGTYQITAAFIAQAPPGQSVNRGGGFPGRDGSIMIGRARFTIH